MVLEAEGRAALALGSETTPAKPGLSGDLTGFWESTPLPLAKGQEEVWVQVTCPPEANRPLTIYSIAMRSDLLGAQRNATNAHAHQPGTGTADHDLRHGLRSARDPGGDGRYRVNGKQVITQPMRSYGAMYQVILPALQESRRAAILGDGQECER